MYDQNYYYPQQLETATYKPQQSNMVSFNVNPVQSTDTGTAPVSINVSRLIEKQIPQKSNMPSAVHYTIEHSVTPQQRVENATIDPSFTALVGPAPDYDIQQKFALQPVPVDLDRSMLPKPDPVVNSVMEDATAHLSKAQSNDRTGKKKINSWFSRILEQKGEDYISSGKLSVDDVSKNAEKILDDMISGRVDYTNQGSIIINPVIINTLISYCANKLAINRAIQFALGYVYNDYTNRSLINDPIRTASLNAIDESTFRNITQAISIVNQDIGVYDILYKKLTYVEATKNASALFNLTNELNAYKKQMKKRY